MAQLQPPVSYARHGLVTSYTVRLATLPLSCVILGGATVLRNDYVSWLHCRSFISQHLMHF